MRWRETLGALSIVSCALIGCASGSDISPRGDGGPLPPDVDRDGARADVDCDDTDPAIGRTAERVCPGECGDGFERCTDAVWSACDAPTDCACTGSGTREIPCEMCGLQTQQCEAGAWAPVGGCTRQGECVPGTVESGDDCGQCGVERRTCTEACGWSAMECVEIADRCDYWVLASGRAEWTGYRLPDGPFAPAAPVRAAIALDGDGDALVLTDTTYHVLRRSCVPRAGGECWVESGARDSLFPETSGAAILFVTDIPASYRGDGRQGIDLLSADTTYRYLRDVATEAITFDAMGPAEPWDGPAAPVRAEVRASWTDVANAAGWITTACGTPTAAVPSAYIGYVARDSVHFFAPGEGCLYFHEEPYATFAPFALPGAPPVDRVGAAYHRSALFVLAETR
jgi:hypothetical protein